MQLHCTLVCSPATGLQGPPVELTIDAPAGTSGAELEAGLAARLGTGPLTVDGVGMGLMELGEPPLVHGAILVDGAANGFSLRTRRSASEPPSSLALAVHSGAGAGTVVPLKRGTYTIGRSGTDILIPDAELSRAHARLVVTDTAITIVDLDSANGTEVDGERVRNAVVSTGTTIRCGNSTLSLIFLDSPGPDLEEAGRSVREPLVVSRHVDAGGRSALLLTAALPLVLGVGLAVFTGTWMFLAFTAVSAVSIVVPVFSARRQRRSLATAVASAVREDQERRRRSAPPLSDLSIPGRLSPMGPGKHPDDERGIWLRLGQAVQEPNIRFEPADPDRAFPSAGLMPLTLDPGRPITAVRGARSAIDGVVRSVLMQLRGYPRGRDTFVVVHGRAEQLPLAARYLPGVSLAANHEALVGALERGLEPTYRHGMLILIDEKDAPVTDSGIIAQAVVANWQVIRLWSGEGGPTAADVELDEHASLLRTGPKGIRFTPDLVPAQVFDRFCRRLARNIPSPGNGERGIPATCSLAEVLPLSREDTSSRWAAGRVSQGLAVPVGRGARGNRLLDFQTDGPHLLLAGTTGAGKSELLRSLTVALALSYPPDRINFLFVDFKGGSGLGPLTGLPHCVGMLTDLTSQELERSLVSLRAEIRLRERLLASVQAPDLASYRASQAGEDSPLPHLFLVIDEFRMLVEEAPEALRELMRIAAIGRSLGIHLIMATQRPQGALTADIRANVTTSIALRVQSEMESLDIINSKAAAGISVDTPGRAYLARGTEAPQEFQAASLGSAAADTEPTGIRIRLAVEALESSAEVRVPPSDPADTPALAAAPLVTTMVELWTATGGQTVRRPIAAPLPVILEKTDMGELAVTVSMTVGARSESPRAGIAPGWSVRLGLMDVPDEQRIVPIAWEPAGQRHLALIGGPESGAREALRSAVDGLACHSTESHLYILDADNTFSGMASHSRMGAQAGLQELRRAVRILERLAREQSERLSPPFRDNATPLVLVIAGWGSWVSAFRSAPLAWAEDLVHDLVRDGGRAGLTVVLSGQRELATARFLGSVPNRVFFPTGSSEDSRIAWPRMPETARVRGRAVAFGALSAGRTAVCQFYAPSRSASSHGDPFHGDTSYGDRNVDGEAATRALPQIRRPFRVEPLPANIPVDEIVARAADHGAGVTAADVRPRQPGPVSPRHHRLCIGVGGDELAPVYLSLPVGGVLAALGGPSSGKTNLLQLLPRLNCEAAGAWLFPEAGQEPCDYWQEVLRKAAAGGLRRRSVALVDDADLLPAAANRDLADLNALGITVVLTATFSPMLMQRVPLVLSARGGGTGLLIAPRSFTDGDVFGVRFEVEQDPPPGRSVLISDGHAMAVQLGWVPP